MSGIKLTQTYKGSDEPGDSSFWEFRMPHGDIPCSVEKDGIYFTLNDEQVNELMNAVTSKWFGDLSAIWHLTGGRRDESE